MEREKDLKGLWKILSNLGPVHLDKEIAERIQEIRKYLFEIETDQENFDKDDKIEGLVFESLWLIRLLKKPEDKNRLATMFEEMAREIRQQ